MESNSTNRLIHEKSPYLLQHAHNPVDWFPWGEEAFEKAKNENKPVLLSIGYATCHWCHVMERESFEDTSTAEFLNRHFVCIKVDREERPDVDKVYMDALQAMNQQGGWPLNIFLTPEGKPIAGGTYFPPKPLYGRKSFLEILELVRRTWVEKPEELQKASENLTNYLQESLQRIKGDLPNPEFLDKTYQWLLRFYDDSFGGFKTNQTNKFPPSMALGFLLRYYKKTGEAKALQMVTHTLQAMRKGGIYDQIGGGLCRYSTNPEWLIPHFEKMLYDNALFIIALVECYQSTHVSFYKEAALDVIRYVERDLRLENEGIASAEDADSEGEEGKFYLWTRKEIQAICGEESDLVCKYFGVTKEGNFEGKSILWEPIFLEALASQENLETEKVRASIEKAKVKLLSERDKRERPLRDDKVITSWNALYVRALAMAGMAFEDDHLIHQAEKTFLFLKENLFTKSGRLLRRFRDGEAKVNGFLNDYSELAHASLFLYQATFEPDYLTFANELVEKICSLFESDRGAFYDTGSDSEIVLRRSMDGYDGVEPSGNSTLAHVLLLLARFGFHTSDYIARAEGIFQFFQKELNEYSISFPFLCSAYWLYSEEGFELAISTTERNQNSQEVISWYRGNFLPASVICYADKDLQDKALDAVPLLEGRAPKSDLDLYLCKNRICKMPVHSLKELKSILAKEFQ